MLAREMIDKVDAAMRAQGRPALSRLLGACSYRAENGDKCAVGHLIPDELYKPEMEGRGAADLITIYPELKKHIVAEDVHSPAEFLTHLQRCHDGAGVENFRQQWALNVDQLIQDLEDGRFGATTQLGGET